MIAFLKTDMGVLVGADTASNRVQQSFPKSGYLRSLQRLFSFGSIPAPRTLSETRRRGFWAVGDIDPECWNMTAPEPQSLEKKETSKIVLGLFLNLLESIVMYHTVRYHPTKYYTRVVYTGSCRRSLFNGMAWHLTVGSPQTAASSAGPSS